MSCFPNLRWPSCNPDAAQNIFECSNSIAASETCCLSAQTQNKDISNCPTGWVSHPDQGEWCTSDWNALGLDEYRHKCKRECVCDECVCDECVCDECDVKFAIVLARVAPDVLGAKSFKIILGWTSPKRFGVDVRVLVPDKDTIDFQITNDNTSEISPGVFVTELGKLGELLKPSYSPIPIVYTIQLDPDDGELVETKLPVEFPDYDNNNLNCGVPENLCESWEKCVKGRCKTPCPQGLTLCTAVDGTDECVNVENDIQHCGDCNQGCGPLDTCILGTCKPRYPGFV